MRTFWGSIKVRIVGFNMMQKHKETPPIVYDLKFTQCLLSTGWYISNFLFIVLLAGWRLLFMYTQAKGAEIMPSGLLPKLSCCCYLL